LGGGADNQQLVDAMLGRLEAMFGVTVFDEIMIKIAEDYFDNRLDISAAILERPDQFERAFLEILGESMGEKILTLVFRSLTLEYDRKINGTVLIYSTKGDVARLMAALASLK
jgi:hypothetical protein